MSRIDEDIDNLDLVVEPHEWMPDDREVIRQTIEELRNRETDVRMAEHMKQWLAQRREAFNLASQPAEG